MRKPTIEDIRSFVPDIIEPICKAYNVSREEAEQRMYWLQQGNLLSQGNPDDPHQQQMIDEFLARDSQDCRVIVLLDICVNECLSNTLLVRQFDRLNMSNLSGALEMARRGKQDVKLQKLLSKFTDFVTQTIFPQFLKSQDTNYDT